MLALSRWKVILVALSALFGILFTLPNLLPADVVRSLPAFMPSSRLSLGLDLQGGSYLLEEVDTRALLAERLTNLTEDIRDQAARRPDRLHRLGGYRRDHCRAHQRSGAGRHCVQQSE